MSETGVWGRQPPPNYRSKKVFCQTFSKKSLCERSSQNKNNKIFDKPQRATIGRPYKNKIVQKSLNVRCSPIVVYPDILAALDKIFV